MFSEVEVALRYIFLIGATASGKSHFAFKLALKCKAVIVNCDSMQIYRALPILTAQPGKDLQQQIEHKLYSYVEPNISYNVARWLQDVKFTIEQSDSSQRFIFVGGTGLYFRCLLQGLVNIPEIREEVRNYWREQANILSCAELYDILQKKDIKSAQLLLPNDTQRIVRALEVLDSTGKALHQWQKTKTKPLLKSDHVLKYVINIDRAKLYNNIERRFDNMVKEGAIDEVKDLLLLNLPQDAPIMSAIGVREFASYLANQCDLAKAIELAKTRTRQYAKRQLTWQRHQLSAQEWQPITM